MKTPTRHENGANPAAEYLNGLKIARRGLLGALTGHSGVDDDMEALATEVRRSETARLRGQAMGAGLKPYVGGVA